ncbi:MAG TPA: hypothetical protein VHQ01_03670 [Pyrinomonadaceae bacterium]|jgi:hypothetical protein|nr:hypothetical protein [Pyrinomonadaceae bacterium]
MKLLQAIEVRKLVEPAAVNDNTAFTTDTIDTKGYAECMFIIQFGAMDIAAAVFKLKESDDSGMSGAVDVTGADFSVSPLTLPSATDDHHLFGIHVLCGGPRKRYLDLSFTAGDGAVGTYASGVVLLASASKTLPAASLQGFTQLACV